MRARCLTVWRLGGGRAATRVASDEVSVIPREPPPREDDPEDVKPARARTATPTTPTGGAWPWR